MPAPATSPEVSDLHSRLAKIKTERLHSQPPLQVSRLSDEELASRLDGRLIAEGVIQIQRRFPLSGKLGRINLADCHHLPCLPGEAETDNRRAVYLDTETTGLSGGSGTMIFLIGIATVDESEISLHQFLLTRFSGEAGLLSTFADALSPMDKLVSYNGKSYDLPLLISRFRMQGLSHPFDGLPHLDLLHPVRRLFSKRWADCRLTTLETNLLGFQRVDDLPGAQAPAAWFDYVRHGWAEKLIRVVAHNQQDILSLVVAHSALAQAIEQPQAFEVDLHALARWLSETDERRALELLLSHSDRLCNDGKRLLGTLARRAGDWVLAVKFGKSSLPMAVLIRSNASPSITNISVRIWSWPSTIVKIYLSVMPDRVAWNDSTESCMTLLSNRQSSTIQPTTQTMTVCFRGNPMGGRCYLDVQADELADYLDRPTLPSLTPRYNIAPSQSRGQFGSASMVVKGHPPLEV